MNISSARQLLSFFAPLFVVTLFLTPHVGLAQSAPAVSTPEDQLSTTIRQAITSDPRSANLTKVQIDTMVRALAKQAQKQGMTTHDITWRPTPAPTVNASATFVENPDCGNMPAFVCNAETAFGIIGGNTWILIGLGIFAGLLIVFIAELLVLHHRKTVAQ